MESQQPEILLLHLSFTAANVQSNGLNRLQKIVAPLGLHCLATMAPERISVIELYSAAQAKEMVEISRSETIKAVILSNVQESCIGELAELITVLRCSFPRALIGCSHDSPATYVCDFIIRGTGKTCILRLLRGDRLTGSFDMLADDLLSPLSFPDTSLLLSGYELETEKWLTGKTLEIMQPWLGLLDQSSEIFTYPGIAWVAEMIAVLQKSGFVAFHFCLCGLSADNLHELRSVMLNLKAPFAVSFKIDDIKQITSIGYPLLQIWLCDLSASNAAQAVLLMKDIHQADCAPCLKLDRQWLTIEDQQAILALADRIIIKDLHYWPVSALRSLVGRFWGYRKRFFKRLFGLKSAAELIVFMKTAYFILEVLFLSEKKNGGAL